MKHKTYFSHGKLLLAGEYTVLDGGLALAIPTKYGQSLEIGPNSEGTIHWMSFDENGEVWFEGFFSLKSFELLKSSDDSKAAIIAKLLQKARDFNPNFVQQQLGYTITSKLDFPRNWGLGTSSTLINNIAQWSGVDAFKLLWEAFGGSGYDIAVAQSKTPIFYQKVGSSYKVKPVKLDWNFKEQLFFVYLNRKQNSKEGISLYQKTTTSKKSLEKISNLCIDMKDCNSLSKFEQIIFQLEKMVSEILQIPAIKQSLFPDYPGAIKSLGAWGGDFIMATGTKEEQHYFKEKGFNTIIPFKEMIL